MKPHSILNGTLCGFCLLTFILLPVHTFSQTVKYFGLDGGVSLTKEIGTTEGDLYFVVDSVLTISDNRFGNASTTFGGLIGIQLSPLLTFDFRIGYTTSSTESYASLPVVNQKVHDAGSGRDTTIAVYSDYDFFRDWTSASVQVGLGCNLVDNLTIAPFVEAQYITSSSELCYHLSNMIPTTPFVPPVGVCTSLPNLRHSISKLRRLVFMTGLSIGYDLHLSTQFSLRPFAQCKYSLKPLLTTADSHVLSTTFGMQALFYL